jgi:thiol-disulfide isomerase/thioredoxin
MIPANFKTIFLLVISLSVCACKRNAAITITGKVSGMDGVSVKLISTDYKTVYDSTIVKNGQFSFRSILPEKGFYEIDFKSPMVNRRGWMHGCLFFAENDAKYTFLAKNPEEILYNRYQIITTSFEQNKLNEYNKIVLIKQDSLKLIRKHYIKISDYMLNNNKMVDYANYLDSIKTTDYKINQSSITSIHQFVKGNNNSIIVPYLITLAGDLFENYTLYHSVLKQLTPEVKASKYYKEANGLLQATKNLYIGAHAPSLYGQDGNEFKMSYTGKKVILIDFWASYCLPCRQQIPDMKKLYDQYKSKGFDIVSVSIDEDPLKWGRASRQDSIPWHNIAELTDQSKSKNIKNFVVKSIPANYVLNNKGELIGRNIDLDTLESMLKSVK